MNVFNVHERDLDATLDEAGTLIDGLASKDDALWPRNRWPPMRFDKPLGIGAKGGHGPIRYAVEAYDPGRKIVFRFYRPKGFIGCHRFELIAVSPERVKLRHEIDMQVEGGALLQWALATRPLHDALLEDALDRAVACFGGQPVNKPWSPWVRTIRWAMSKARSSKRGRR